MDPKPDRPRRPAPEPEAAEEWTVLKLLTWTADFLRRKGAETPRLDAEVLLAHVLKCARVQLYTNFQQSLDEGRRAEFRALLKRRAEGMPVAYLVGRKEFYSLTLAVNPAVLIPRPDTETLVAEFLSRAEAGASVRALDVGTGSGAIALACLSRNPGARFIATDLSEAAIAQASENAESLGLSDRVEFRVGDLFGPVAAEPPFDAVLSNPPYIPTATISGLEPGVRDFEPHLALDGGPDGLAVVSRLVAGASDRLRPGGLLLIEIGADQEAPVRGFIEAEPGLRIGPTVRDAANHPRVVPAVRGG